MVMELLAGEDLAQSSEAGRRSADRARRSTTSCRPVDAHRRGARASASCTAISSPSNLFLHATQRRLAARQGPRLRHLQGDGRRRGRSSLGRSDGDQRGHGLAALHVARAGAQREARRRARRHLVARRHPARASHRKPGLPSRHAARHLRGHHRRRSEPLCRLRPDAPASLEAVLTRCLEKSVKRRFQTTHELIQALRPFGSAATTPSGASSSPTLPEAGLLPESDRASLKPRSSPRRESLAEQATQISLSSSSRREDPLGLDGPHRFGWAGAGPADCVRAAQFHDQPPARGAGPLGRMRTALWMALGALLVAVVGVVILATRQGPVAEAGPGTPLPAREAPDKKSFVLFVESTPSGAVVVEGNEVIGKTPLQLSIDNQAARTEARKLIVQHEGYSAVLRSFRAFRRTTCASSPRSLPSRFTSLCRLRPHRKSPPSSPRTR